MYQIPMSSVDKGFHRRNPIDLTRSASRRALATAIPAASTTKGTLPFFWLGSPDIASYY